MVTATAETLGDNFPETIGEMQAPYAMQFARATLKTLLIPGDKSMITISALGAVVVAIWAPPGWAEATE
jgi:hypothetical protein